MKTNESSTASVYWNQNEISRVLTAAVVNENFRKMLLANPEQALVKGYRGEAFHFSKEERSRLGAIHASSLTEFAAQIPRQ
jgi:hypothetical protein